jgi:ketol-acid reductoisomerase
VTVGLRTDSPSREEASAAGFTVADPGKAARDAAIVALLIPDEKQGELYAAELDPVMGEGTALLFAHGFAVHFGLLIPSKKLDVVLAAPKGPGYQVREEFRRGRGVAAFVAVHQDVSGRARETALAYALAIGSGRTAILEGTFREECETDLFGEQAVICGGLSHLISAGFDTLVDAGYPPELAYLECLHEVKFVADLIHRRGIEGMRQVISKTARFGDLTRGPRIIGPTVRREMQAVLDDIRGGRFARELVDAGDPAISDGTGGEKHRLLEEVGEKMREVLFRPGG